MRRIILINGLLASVLVTASCGQSPGSQNSATANPASASVNSAWPMLVVHKNATCGCCRMWVDHMKRAGFNVDVRDVDNLNDIKTSVGIPAGKGSCHTAQVDRYFVEGHVPAEDVIRLLSEHPDAKGLAVPGMPAGSPGMELPSGKIQPYDVYLVANDGSTSVYAHHGDASSH